MKTLLPTINKWTTANQPFAIATVTHTWGSSPRPIGSALIVNEAMEMAGSVSGGCVEGSCNSGSIGGFKKWSASTNYLWCIE